MAKLYFIRYLESRNDMVVEATPTFVMRVSFDAGLPTTRNCGFQRKAHALRYIERINRAAGKVIAEYAGSLEPTPWR